MSASESSFPAKLHRKIRRDGWTAERQLRFLDALARTRSVTKAAAAAGMSRESAYRLRGRRDGALFAAAWNRALEGHKLVTLHPRHRGRPVTNSRENPPKVTNPTHPTIRPRHRPFDACCDPEQQAAAEFFETLRAALEKGSLAEKR
jgi:hypothetical protein